MKYQPPYRLVVAMAALAATFFLGPNAYADSGLRIQPVKVSHTIEKGRTASGIITLTNAGSENLNVEVNVEDFIPNAGGRGVQFVGRAPGITTATDWISLKTGNSFFLPKDGSVDIPYTIRAPLDAEPGSHFGVAFFKGTKTSVTDEEQLKVGTQVGMLILITVPGNHLQKGKILDFYGPKFIQRGPVDFKIKFENTGTVHFEPKGIITIRNIFHKVVGQASVEGHVVLPTGVEELTSRWNVTGFLLGAYTASIEIKDGEGEVLTTREFTFYAVPIFYILAFIGLVIMLFFTFRFIKRRVRISVTLKDDDLPV